MKTLNCPSGWAALASSILLVSSLPAAPAEPETAAPDQPAATSSTPAPKLPYGVEDVLKLTRAQISDDIVVNYVENSGTVYNLSPADIVYLRNEGVSDRVVNAMLDQRKKPADGAQNQATATAQPPATAAAPGPDSAPPPVYVQAAPSQPAPSTVYVIPYPAASAAYYGAYRPYYSGYYGGYYGPYCGGGYYGPYYGPSISFGFRFGGGHWGGHWGGHGWHH